MLIHLVNCFRPLLKQMNNTDANIILDCKTENIIPILSQAKDLNMMDVQDSYILTALVTQHIFFYRNLKYF